MICIYEALYCWTAFIDSPIVEAGYFSCYLNTHKTLYYTLNPL